MYTYWSSPSSNDNSEHQLFIQVDVIESELSTICARRQCSVVQAVIEVLQPAVLCAPLQLLQTGEIANACNGAMTCMNLSLLTCHVHFMQRDCNMKQQLYRQKLDPHTPQSGAFIVQDIQYYRI